VPHAAPAGPVARAADVIEGTAPAPGTVPTSVGAPSRTTARATDGRTRTAPEAATGPPGPPAPVGATAAVVLAAARPAARGALTATAEAARIRARVPVPASGLVPVAARTAPARPAAVTTGAAGMIATGLRATIGVARGTVARPTPIGDPDRTAASPAVGAISPTGGARTAAGPEPVAVAAPASTARVGRDRAVRTSRPVTARTGVRPATTEVRPALARTAPIAVIAPSGPPPTVPDGWRARRGAAPTVVGTAIRAGLTTGGPGPTGAVASTATVGPALTAVTGATA
jgi:DNA segregation ATPase FtsK/SpoIIIE, S-DNA-T family